MQFLQMRIRQLIQDLSSLTGNTQADSPAVIRVECALQQPLFFAAVHQFHHAVVLQSQALRRIRNGRKNLWRGTRDGEQQLMLPRMQAEPMDSIFTGEKEGPQLIAKFRKGPMQGPIRLQRCTVERHSDFILS